MESLRFLVRQDIGKADTEMESLREMVRQDLRGQGYQVIGEIPEEEPVRYPEGTYPGLTPPPTTPSFGRPGKGVRRYPAEEWHPGKAEPLSREEIGDKTFWQTVKDFATGFASGDPMWQQAAIGNELVKRFSFGNLDAKELGLQIADKIKPGSRQEYLQMEDEMFRGQLGYHPGEKQFDIPIVGGKITGPGAAMAPVGLAGSLAGYSMLLRGVGPVAGAVSKALKVKIPMLQRWIRGILSGVAAGPLAKPEEEGVLNRLKQIPSAVLFFTVLETGMLTVGQVARIIKWNKQYGATLKKVKGAPEKAFDAQTIKNIYSRMNTNVSGAAKVNLEPWEVELVEDLKLSKGWSDAIKKGWIKPGVAVPEGLPRKPRFPDIFRDPSKLGQWEIPPTRGEPVPGAEPPPPRGEAPALLEAEAGARPQVIVDVDPKPGGGYEYKFSIPEPTVRPTPEVGPRAVVPWRPVAARVLPEAKIPAVKPVPKERKAKVFKDPLYEAINQEGGIAPNPDYGYTALRQILPFDLIRKAGKPMDIMAQTLRHQFPKLEGDNDLFDLLDKTKLGKVKYQNVEARGEDVELPQQYYDDLLDESIIEAVEAGREGDLSPDEIERLGELRREGRAREERVAFGEKRLVVANLGADGKIYYGEPGDTHGQLSERYSVDVRKKANLGSGEATWKKVGFAIPGGEVLSREEALKLTTVQPTTGAGKLDAMDYLEQEIQGKKLRFPEKLVEPRPTVREPKDLFGREVEAEAPPKERIKPIEEKAAPLFEEEIPVAKFPEGFDSRGLRSYPDVNKARTAAQPLVDKGWELEMGQAKPALRGGAKKGWVRLVKKNEPGQGSLKYIAEAKPPEFLEKKEIQYETREKEPTMVFETATEAQEKTLLKLFEELGVERKSWGPVSERILKNYDISKGKFENYSRSVLTKIIRGRGFDEAGEEIGPPLTEKPPLTEEDAVAGSRFVNPETRFEKAEELVRVRKRFKEASKDDLDLDILESRILDMRPNSYTAIAKRHGVSITTVRNREKILLEKLRGDKDVQAMIEERMKQMNIGPAPSRKDLNNLRDWINRYFTSSKGVSQEIDAVNDERIGNIAAMKFESSHEGKAIQKFLDDNNNNEALCEFVLQILEGEFDPASTALPDDIKDHLRAMRARIDKLSQLIITHGALTDQTKAVFEQNMGRYLGTFYRLHQQKRWDPPEDVRNRFKNMLEETEPERFAFYSEEQLDNYLDGLIGRKKRTGIRRSKQKRVPTGHYVSKKTRLSLEWKEFAGEIQDEPVWTYLMTVADNAAMAYNAKFINKLKEAYPDLWTASKDEADRLGWQKSRMPEGYGYGELKGKYVHPDLKDFIEQEVDPTLKGVAKFFQDVIVTPFKINKTIGSIPTHGRNFAANVPLSMLGQNCIHNPANIPYYVKATKVFMLRNKSMKKEWAKVIKLGVTGTQYYGTEVPKFYNDLLRLDPVEWPEKIHNYLIKSGINKAGNLYNFEDALYRLAAYYKYTDKFGWSDKEAVKEIDLNFTNYRKLPVIVEVLRRWPVLGPFVSFKWNIAKITANNMATAAKEMASADAKTRWRGSKRWLRVLLYLGIPSILAKLSNEVFDVDEDMIKELEKRFPKYRRNGVFMYFRWPPFKYSPVTGWEINRTSELKALDLTYIYPTGDFERGFRALIAALKGDPTGVESMKDAMDLFAHPIFDAWSVLIEGRNPYWGTKVKGGFLGRIAEVAKLLWIPASAPIPSIESLNQLIKTGKFEPRAGMLTGYQIKAIIDAYWQEPDQYGRVKVLPEEVKNFFTGLRTWNVEPGALLAQYINTQRGERNDAVASFKSWMRRHTKAPAWELADQIKALEKKLKKIDTNIMETIDLLDKLWGNGLINKTGTEAQKVTKSTKEAKWEMDRTSNFLKSLKKGKE